MIVVLLVLSILLFVVLPLIGATLMQLVWALVTGLVLGGLARLIVPGRTKLGCLTTALVGVAGSLLGTVAARALETGWFGRTLLQVGVAVVLVLVLRPTKALAP